MRKRGLASPDDGDGLPSPSPTRFRLSRDAAASTAIWGVGATPEALHHDWVPYE